MENKEEIYLELQNITKKFSEFSLSDVSYKFYGGKWYYLKGNNGAGKTTLLNLIMRFLFQDNGTIFYFGKTMDKNEIEIKQKIAYIPNYITLPLNETPLFLGKLYRSMYKNFDQKIYAEHLEKLGIKDEKQKIFQMSDGTKKKVQIALNLSFYPKIFIGDEIWNDLDRSSIDYCIYYMEKLRIEKNTLFIISTHTEENSKELTPIIINMQEGKMVDSK